MMRKLAIVQLAVVFGCLQAATVFAANADTGPGCGLGKLAWGEYKHQKSILPQVLMATTNGTFGSQTFGISTGTSGCTNDGTILASEKVNVFAAINFDNLAQEMAQGRGEHLTSLATLLGVPEDQQPAFFAMTQEKYATLIQSGQTTPVAMLSALHDAMAAHPVLTKLTNR
jgi:DUF3015 family protein